MKITDILTIAALIGAILFVVIWGASVFGSCPVGMAC